MCLLTLSSLSQWFEPVSHCRILRRTVWKSIRALMLLGALLCPAGGALAGVFSLGPTSSCTCCRDDMCPMPHRQSTPHKNALCKGHRGSSPTCFCGRGQPAQLFLLHLVPEVILTADPPESRPQAALRKLTFRGERALLRANSPPDHPPRL